MTLRQGSTLYYLLTDHLGSTALVTNASWGVVGQQRYHPYGAGRPTDTALPTDYRFTGQRREGTIRLYDYGARFYDPLLGRFLSADTLVPQPGNPQALNRYVQVAPGWAFSRASAFADAAKPTAQAVGRRAHAPSGAVSTASRSDSPGSYSIQKAQIMPVPSIP